MASYHCTVKAGASSNAAAHAAYVERDGKYKTRGGKDRDDVEAVESGNMPSWAASSAAFWKASDLHERVNAAGYREYEVALPRELTPAQRLELVRDFVAQELGDRHAYTFAIHNPKAAIEGGEQPHAHIMFSERVLDGIERLTPEHYFKRANSKNPASGGLKKANGTRKTDAERKAELVDLRERWASMQNKHLAQAGAADRVDHRSNEDRGIKQTPEQHLGHRRVHTGSGLARAVIDARSAKRDAGQVERDLAAARRRVERLVALQAGKKAQHSRQGDKVPARRPGVQRDQLEAAAEQLAQAWKQCLYAERDGYVLEMAAKALQALNNHLKQAEAHQGSKPVFFGRKEWEATQQAIDRRGHALRRRVDDLETGRYPAEHADNEAVEREVVERATAKNPKLAAAQAAVTETLLAKSKREMEKRMAKMRVELAAKAAAKAQKQERGRSR